MLLPDCGGAELSVYTAHTRIIRNLIGITLALFSLLFHDKYLVHVFSILRMFLGFFLGMCGDGSNSIRHTVSSKTSTNGRYLHRQRYACTFRLTSYNSGSARKFTCLSFNHSQSNHHYYFSHKNIRKCVLCVCGML